MAHAHTHHHSDAHSSAHLHRHAGHHHAPASPHPPAALLPSLIRQSLAQRLAIAGFVCAVLWSAVWLAISAGA
jgi:hypothetical protein